jgi:hypothetical protein
MHPVTSIPLVVVVVHVEDDVSELQPPTSICSSPKRYMSMESHGGMILTGDN